MNPDNRDRHDTCGAFGLNKTVCVLDRGHAGKHQYEALKVEEKLAPRAVNPLALAVVASAVMPPLPERRNEWKAPSSYNRQQKNKRKRAMKQQRLSRRRNRAR